MTGGSYLVDRRIRMLVDSWDTDYRADTNDGQKILRRA